MLASLFCSHYVVQHLPHNDKHLSISCEVDKAVTVSQCLGLLHLVDAEQRACNLLHRPRWLLGRLGFRGGRVKGAGPVDPGHLWRPPVPGEQPAPHVTHAAKLKQERTEKQRGPLWTRRRDWCQLISGPHDLRWISQYANWTRASRVN